VLDRRKASKKQIKPATFQKKKETRKGWVASKAIYFVFKGGTASNGGGPVPGGTIASGESVIIILEG